jgi:hypothetical protein
MLGSMTRSAPQSPFELPEVRAVVRAVLPERRKRIAGIDGCCPAATTGHAAAPPSPAMNSRRLMHPSKKGAARLTHSGARLRPAGHPTPANQRLIGRRTAY